jgi:nitroimidazol reductase NimA-like FMN-containing flavoprotein (pyridoxamine 5'-phosphate oxidase superfamily)
MPEQTGLQGTRGNVKLMESVKFRELTDDEIRSLLTRNNVGRLAFSFHDRVDIRPIHYVYRDHWLYGRTSPSEKLETLRHNQWVAFEVDEVRGPFDWESVVAHGSFYHVGKEGSPQSLELKSEALQLIRTIAPDAFRETDPVPFRTELFAIAIDSLTGRAASTA